ncbi:MAG: hypothetical protein IIB04_02885 [Acidobacteria bacterium]|nr:hypothetical protein [Acidobacteriota bacterium]
MEHDFCGTISATIPIIIVLFAFQRHLVQGAAESGTKGQLLNLQPPRPIKSALSLAERTVNFDEAVVIRTDQFDAVAFIWTVR